MNRRVWLIGLLAWLGFLPWPLQAQKKLHVLTSFLPAYSLASSVAGELATVENLLPGSVSLHEYQLSPADLRKIKAADIIVVNGLGLESFLQRALQNAGPKPVVELSAGLGKELIPDDGHHAHAGHDHDHDHHHSANPHIWLDPLIAAQSVTNLVEAFSKLDPPNAALYRQNGAATVQRLQDLHAELTQKLQPLKNVPFITYHNAFPYFTRRYGLNFCGVVEQVPEVAPAPREMSALRILIREKQVKVLFTAPGEETSLARQIAKDNKITLAELDPLETGKLTPHAYEEGMRRNAETLVKALK